MLGRYLQSLAYHIDVDEHLDITNYQGQVEGKLHAGLCPCDSTGKALTEDMFVSNPTELLGNRMDLLVKINGATELQWMKEDPTRGVSCRFKFYTDVKFRSTRTIQHEAEPKFDYSKQFTIKQVGTSLNPLQCFRALQPVVGLCLFGLCTSAVLSSQH